MDTTNRRRAGGGEKDTAGTAQSDTPPKKPTGGRSSLVRRAAIVVLCVSAIAAFAFFAGVGVGNGVREGTGGERKVVQAKDAHGKPEEIGDSVGPIDRTVWSHTPAEEAVLSLDGVKREIKRMAVPLNPADAGEVRPRETRIRTKERFAIHVSTDKPIYHEGDTMFVRAVVLDAFTHKPMDEERESTLPPWARWRGRALKVEILSPKGSVLHTGRPQLESSVAAESWTVPRGSVGGEYVVRVTPASGFLSQAAPVERKVDVRSYRPPRLNIEVVLDRAGYAPGDTATATVKATRAEGGPCSGASVTARAIFGDHNEEQAEVTLSAIGMATVAFVVPKDVGGDGTFSVTVADGGIVESAAKTVPVIASTKDITVTFYPESGEFLLEGVTNRVYFEAKNKMGDPADISGDVVGSDAVHVAKGVSTAHEGRGVFEFVPVKGIDYSFVLSSPAGVGPLSLPKARASGVVGLRILDPVVGAADPVRVAVSIPPSQSSRKLLVGLFQKERLEAAAVMEFEASDAPATRTAAVYPHNDTSGVLRVTVFGGADEHSLPVAERLAFRKPRSHLSIHVSPSSKMRSPGDPVVLEVKTSDSASGKPVAAVVGVTVTDNSVLGMVEKRKRAPRLPAMVFLEHEVERLDDANVYLEDDSKDAGSSLDLLLGTQGWRRFAYIDVDGFIDRMGDKALAVLAHNNAPAAEEDVMLRAEMMKAVMFVAANAPQEDAAEGAIPPQMPAGMPMADFGGGKQNAGDELNVVAAPAADRQPWFPQEGVVAVREYSYAPSASRRPGERSEFAETVLFHAAAKTDASGTALLKFHVSDLITTFAVLADGFTSEGAIGYGDASVECIQPFHISPKVPVSAVVGDHIVIPIGISNDGAYPVTVSIVPSSSTSAISFPRPTQNLPAKKVPHISRTRQLLEADVTSVSGDTVITFVATAGDHTDVVKVPIASLPPGFPIDIDRGGLLSPTAPAEFDFAVPDGAQNVSTSGNLYATPAANIMQALAALIREPFGCFEQTSSVTYPTIMAMQYFATHGVDSRSKAYVDAARNLEKGYKLLSGYEVKGGGFEWFGSSPAHEALTAYGLLEFVDMSSVFPVDKQLIKRTKDWLLGQRTGDGFQRNSKQLDTFGGAPDSITNAYIVWSLTYAGITEGLEAQIGALVKQSETSNDPYFLALVAGIKHNTGKDSTGLCREVAKHQNKDGTVTNAETSITLSSSDPLLIETTSIAVLAWLPHDEFAGNVEKAMEWLATRCKDGKFGSTQGTVLALKAIIAYDMKRRSQQKPFTAVLSVDGAEVEEISFDPKNKQQHEGPLSFGDFASALTTGKSHRIKVALRCDGDCGDLKTPFSVHLRYFADIPAGDSDPQIGLAVKLDGDGKAKEANAVKEGASVVVTASITNLKNATHGMVVAIIGIPAGLEVRHDRLKELVAAKEIAFFETRGTEVVLYWRSLGPLHTKEVKFDCTATIPGQFTGTASRAYPYYNDASKTWVEPLTISVNPMQ